MEGRVAVVGEGIGALVAALRLAGRGHRVELFDPRPCGAHRPTARDDSDGSDDDDNDDNDEPLGAISEHAARLARRRLEELGVGLVSGALEGPCAKRVVVLVGEQRLEVGVGLLDLAVALVDAFPRVETGVRELTRLGSSARAMDALRDSTRERGILLRDAPSWLGIPAYLARRGERLSSVLARGFPCALARAFAAAALSEGALRAPSSLLAMDAAVRRARLDAGALAPRIGRGQLEHALLASCAARDVRVHRGARLSRVRLERTRAHEIELSTGEIMRADALVSTLGEDATRDLLDDGTRAQSAKRAFVATLTTRTSADCRALGAGADSIVCFADTDVDTSLELPWEGHFAPNPGLTLRVGPENERARARGRMVRVSGLVPCRPGLESGSATIQLARLDAPRARVARHLLAEVLRRWPDLSGRLSPERLTLRSLGSATRSDATTRLGPHDGCVIDDDSTAELGFDRSMAAGIELAEQAEEALAMRLLVRGRPPARVSAG